MSTRGMQSLRVIMLGICAPGRAAGSPVPGCSPAPGSFPAKPCRRYRYGAGALLAVLLLAALAGTGLAAHYAAQHAARQTATAFQAGRVFAAWVLAAHRASQEQEFGARLAVEPSFVLTPAALRGLGAVPPGLPESVGRDVAFTVGIMDDGAALPERPRVAMAFGVVEPAGAEAAAALRQGAIAAGLAALAEAGSDASVMAAHVPGIESALGRPLAAPALYVTADAGLRYRDQVLYRRAQPGRLDLNRMETILDAGGNDVTGVAAAEGFTASLSKDGTAGGGGDRDGGCARGRPRSGIARSRRSGCGLPLGIDGAGGRARSGGTGRHGHGLRERPSRGEHDDRRRFPDRADAGGCEHGRNRRSLLRTLACGRDARRERRDECAADRVHRAPRPRRVDRGAQCR